VLVMWRLGVKGQNVLVMWRLFGLLVRESRYWRWLFHCEPVRGPLICHGGAWAGRLRRRYSPCQAAGAPPAVPGRWRASGGASGCATGGATGAATGAATGGAMSGSS